MHSFDSLVNACFVSCKAMVAFGGWLWCVTDFCAGNHGLLTEFDVYTGFRAGLKVDPTNIAFCWKCLPIRERANPRLVFSSAT